MKDATNTKGEGHMWIKVTEKGKSSEFMVNTKFLIAATAHPTEGCLLVFAEPVGLMTIDQSYDELQNFLADDQH